MVIIETDILKDLMIMESLSTQIVMKILEEPIYQ